MEWYEKNDLKKLYIDEGKTIQRISKIYGCHRRVIEKKLKEYDISIRPRGSFLVDENGKTLSSKLTECKIDKMEYQNELYKSKGHKNHSDYLDELAKNRGFKDNADYQQKKNFEKGIGSGLSMYENKNSSDYLGIVIAERMLPKIFNDVKMMPYGNPNYDAVCNRNLKIEVKCSTLHKNNSFDFVINKNKIADYFLMIAFDNRNDLNVNHIWLIKGNVVIEKNNQYNSKEFIFNEIQVVSIRAGKSGLKRYEQYEMTDRLDEIQKICDEFKMK